MRKWNLLNVIILKGGYSSSRKLRFRRVKEPTQGDTVRKW